MKSIYNLLDSPEFISYLEKSIPRNFLGDEIFVKRPIGSLKFDYVKGANQLPVMAKVVPVGSEAPILDRNSVSKVAGKIPVVKIKIDLDEDLYIELRKATRKGYDIPDDVIRKIYDDSSLILSSIANKIEFLKIQALCKGELDFIEDGFNYQINYQMPLANKPTASVLWDDPVNADPEKDMNTWKNYLLDNGKPRPEKSICSNKVLQNILRSQKIRTSMFGINSTQMPSKEELNNYFAKKELPQIATYDLSGKLYNGPTVKYLDEEKFIMLPGDGIAGEALQGPTAESFLNNDVEGIPNTPAKVQQIDAITLVQWMTIEPFTVWTKGATAQLPSLPYIDGTISATVITKS